MWIVYILVSLKNGSFYVGSTNDFDRRLYEHSIGHTPSTRYKLPLDVIYYEFWPDRLSARQRELQIKSYKGGEGFKKLINL